MAGIPDYRYTGMKSEGRSYGGYKILGMPPQWDSYTDMRMNKAGTDITELGNGGTGIGRIQNKLVLKHMQPLIIRVGLPKFMAFLSSKEGVREGLITLLNEGTKQEAGYQAIDSGDGSIDEKMSKISKLLQGNAVQGTRYYDFNDSFSLYLSDVSNLVNYLLRKLKIVDSRIQGDSHRFNARSYISSGSGWFGRYNDTGEERPLHSEYLSIFTDTTNSYSESFSNNTRESMVSGFLKKFQGFAKEIMFFNTGNNWIGSLSDTVSEWMSGLSGWSNGGTTGLMADSAKTMLSGGSILFPEIWDDSSMSKSYNISIKLVATNGSPFCIFYEILVPLCFILCLALPRYISEIGYASPYIIKAYSRGHFVCDLGMINSLDIKRSEWSAANFNGSGLSPLPTAVEINIGIKDLYPTLVMGSSNKNAVDNNVSIYEYLSIMAGRGLVESRLFEDIKENIKAGWERLANPFASQNSIASQIKQKFFAEIGARAEGLY